MHSYTSLIYAEHQCFLRFAVGKRALLLPFGLASASTVFTKVLAPVLALLRQRGITVLGYLEDLLLRADSHSALLGDLTVTIRTLQEFGWNINFKKICPGTILGHYDSVESQHKD